MLEWILTLFIGWNVITVSEPTYPPDVTDAHPCIEAMWWQHEGEWRLWDTDMYFGASDFFADHGVPGSGKWATYWMEPEKAYWVYCAE